ncbi:MAG: metallophosphoesterase family protein [Thermodesulfobacteriota bacterium]|nr:metallophosphoesterase family protein [Thermodesulfobacteriota bacterium]
MKFAVMSDSHGHIENVERLAARLVKAGVRHAVHLGDNYDDASPLIAAGLEVLRVPGVYSEWYQDPNIPNRLLTELGGLKILLTHTDAPHKNDGPADEDPARTAEFEKPDLVLFGHTHLPAIEKRQGVLWVNPGHLKPEDKKGAPPSYAVVDTSAQPFKVWILAFEDGGALMEN